MYIRNYQWPCCRFVLFGSGCYTPGSILRQDDCWERSEAASHYTRWHTCEVHGSHDWAYIIPLKTVLHEGSSSPIRLTCLVMHFWSSVGHISLHNWPSTFDLLTRSNYQGNKWSYYNTMMWISAIQRIAIWQETSQLLLQVYRLIHSANTTYFFNEPSWISTCICTCVYHAFIRDRL